MNIVSLPYTHFSLSIYIQNNKYIEALFVCSLIYVYYRAVRVLGCCSDAPRYTESTSISTSLHIVIYNHRLSTYQYVYN